MFPVGRVGTAALFVNTGIALLSLIAVDSKKAHGIVIRVRKPGPLSFEVGGLMRRDVAASAWRPQCNYCTSLSTNSTADTESHHPEFEPSSATEKAESARLLYYLLLWYCCCFSNDFSSREGED